MMLVLYVEWKDDVCFPFVRRVCIEELVMCENLCEKREGLYGYKLHETMIAICD